MPFFPALGMGKLLTGLPEGNVRSKAWDGLAGTAVDWRAAVLKADAAARMRRTSMSQEPSEGPKQAEGAGSPAGPAQSEEGAEARREELGEALRRLGQRIEDVLRGVEAQRLRAELLELGRRLDEVLESERAEQLRERAGAAVAEARRRLEELAQRPQAVEAQERLVAATQRLVDETERVLRSEWAHEVRTRLAELLRRAADALEPKRGDERGGP